MHPIGFRFCQPLEIGRPRVLGASASPRNIVMFDPGTTSAVKIIRAAAEQVNYQARTDALIIWVMASVS